MQLVKTILQRIQDRLNFERWDDYRQFAHKKTLGRTALLAACLAGLLGIHAILWLQMTLDITHVLPFHVGKYLGRDRLFLGWQWCAYAVAVTTFHLLEFFCTAVYNPTQVSADSFLVNHSVPYTAAVLASWTEFGLRLALAPHRYSVFASMLGLFVVILSQLIRSLAMKTAGESFNHLIQTSKRDNHVLVTHGIYYYLRHPSYIGFYYWSVGTQVLLGNVVCAVVFASVSWSFFARRIAFEEESLCQHFAGAYEQYVSRTWSGIPFLRTQINISRDKKA